MEQIDWSKAPDGATHFLPEQDSRGWISCWYKNVDGTWFARNSHDCDWYPDHDYTEIFIPLLIEQPKPWTGEGIPPAGAEFEYTTNDGYNWHRGSMLFSDAQVVLLSGYHLFKIGDPDLLFRQIITPEQIEAKAREAAITDIALIMGKDPDRPLIREKAAIIYDAGYRKTNTK